MLEFDFAEAKPKTPKLVANFYRGTVNGYPAGGLTLIVVIAKNRVPAPSSTRTITPWAITCGGVSPRAQ